MTEGPKIVHILGASVQAALANDSVILANWNLVKRVPKTPPGRRPSRSRTMCHRRFRRPRRSLADRHAWRYGLFMRTRPYCLVALALAACAQHGSGAPAPPVRIGVYRFTERPTGVNTTIQGRVLVTHDSVVVEAEPGPCHYDSRASTAGGPIVYQCADVSISFDRFDPVGRATYRTTKTVMDRKTTCVRYTTDAKGNQVCAQQQTETTEREVPVIGTLHLDTIAHPE